MVGDLNELEKENTLLRDALKNQREKNKYFRDRIAKLTTLLIQNKKEEEEEENAPIREENVLVPGAHKSLETVISLEETSVQPSSFASASIALKENEDLDKKPIEDILKDIIEGKMVFEDVDTEKDRECFKRGMMKLNVLAKRREAEFSSGISDASSSMALDQPLGTLTPPIKRIKMVDAIERDIIPEPPAIEFDISDEEDETEPLSELWGITGDTEVWTREDRI